MREDAVPPGGEALPAGEEALLTSGDFGRRSRLSPKALRLYEQQGLLVPDEVDAASRYRRYRVGRLADARLIVWLRRLDMPLADVARVLAARARRSRRAGGGVLGRRRRPGSRPSAGSRPACAKRCPAMKEATPCPRRS